MRLHAKAVRFGREGKAITAVLLENGERLPCDALFSSMPIKDLVEALPGVPANVHEVASALPYRDFITVELIVDRLALRNRTPIPTLNELIPDT